MSTVRGSDKRTRPQKHQNRTAFKNDLHDTSQKTKKINSMFVTGLCDRCKEIIEWKIKYKKYKMLSAPRKCVSCQEKSVKHAYHVLCTRCSKERNVCSKCCKSIEIQNGEQPKPAINSSNNLSLLLKPLAERKRRTILRYIKKTYAVGEAIDFADVESKIQAVLESMESCSLNQSDSDFSNDDVDDDGDDSGASICS